MSCMGDLLDSIETKFLTGEEEFAAKAGYAERNSVGRTSLNGIDALRKLFGWQRTPRCVRLKACGARGCEERLLVGVVGGFTAFCGDDGRSKNHADEGQSDDDVVHGKVPQAASENRPQVNHRRPVRKNQYN